MTQIESNLEMKKQRIGKFFLISLLVILLDQLSKLAILKTMVYGESIKLIKDILYITSHRNQGAAWGILQGKMTFFYIITTVVLLIMIVAIFKYAPKSRLFGYSAAFLLGGATGNFIDRLFRKEVVDFIHTPIMNFPIFNVADMSLTFGVILLMIYLFIDEKKKKEAMNGKNTN